MLIKLRCANRILFKKCPGISYLHCEDLRAEDGGASRGIKSAYRRKRCCLHQLHNRLRCSSRPARRLAAEPSPGYPGKPAPARRGRGRGRCGWSRPRTWCLGSAAAARVQPGKTLPVVVDQPPQPGRQQVHGPAQAVRRTESQVHQQSR